MKSKISRALPYTLGFAFTGLLVILLEFYVQKSILSTYERNLRLVSLGNNVKDLSAKAHLLFEELLAGDEGIDFERDIVSIFSKADELLKNNIRQVDVHKELADILPLLEKSSNDLKNLVAISKQRVEENKAVVVQVMDSVVAESAVTAGVGTDVKFDAAYVSLQESLDILVNTTNLKTKERISFYARISQIITFVLAMFMTIGCIFLFKVLSKNEEENKRSTALLEQEANRVTALSTFIEQISNGKYNAVLTGLDKHDYLGNTLTKMRDKLGKNAEADYRREWATTGLAKIGTILRANYNSATELYDTIIGFLVKYLECNQGGLFISYGEEHEQYLELVACYAYDRKKFVNKRIDLGEGLIGQCYTEGQKMYLLDVPNEYITITSGLGKSNPTCILLVPMKVNDETSGVIELASFKKLLDYEIELIEKLAESIAATLSTVKANENTKYLLEKSQQQAEELRAQEEEMRQNLEEMEATQEEIVRRQLENENVIRAVNSSMAVVEFDSDANILHANQNFLDLMGYSLSEIKGLHHRMFVDSATRESKEYSEFWNKLASGTEVKGEFTRIDKQGKTVWISGNYTPLFDNSGRVAKIMKVATDITEAKQREQQYSDYIWQLTGKRIQLSKQETAKQVVDQLAAQKGKVVHKKMEFQNIQTDVEIPRTQGGDLDNLADRA